LISSVNEFFRSLFGSSTAFIGLLPNPTWHDAGSTNAEQGGKRPRPPAVRPVVITPNREETLPQRCLTQ
jgi:hypothetical protein